MPTKLLHRKQTTHYSGGVRKRRRAVRGGAQTDIGTAKPFESYALPHGASSQRGAALANQEAMNADQQSMVDKHAKGGGRRKRKMTRRKTKNNRKKNIRRKKTMRRKGKKRTMRKKKKNVRRTRRRTGRSLKRGGANVDSRGCAVPSDPVTVPSFAPPSGGHVGPANSDTASQGGNSTNMQANADACNDHYATKTGGRRRTSRRMKGGFQNWHDHFAGFGEKMTGGKSRKKKAGAKRIWKSCMSGGKNRPFDLSPRDITGAGRGHDGSGTWEKFHN